MLAPTPTMDMEPHLAVLTFNVLAPCYKRMAVSSATDRRLRDREMYQEAIWKQRIDQLLAFLQSLQPTPDIITLQEVWFNSLFLEKLDATFSNEYHIFYAQRPSPKEDGLATLVRKDCPLLTDIRQHPAFTLTPKDDRIALPLSATLTSSATQILLVNTHLTFPHTIYERNRRVRQAKGLNSYVDAFLQAHPLCATSLIVGDFNSDNSSRTARQLRRGHFVNCYSQVNGDVAHPKTHWNHRKQPVFVDHVFLRTSQPRPHSFDSSIDSHVFDDNRTTDDDAELDDDDIDDDINDEDDTEDAMPRRGVSARRVNDASFDSDAHSDVGSDIASDVTVPPHNSQLADARPVAKYNYLQPVSTAVYPENLSHDTWPHSFKLSDHRPLGIVFHCLRTT